MASFSRSTSFLKSISSSRPSNFSAMVCVDFLSIVFLLSYAIRFPVALPLTIKEYVDGAVHMVYLHLLANKPLDTVE